MEKSTKTYLVIAIFAILVQFVVFKLLYPFPGFFPDSFSYIGAARWKEMVSVRPVGYSWFLLAVHALTKSACFLVALQYLLLQTAGLYLFFTVRRFYALSRRGEQLFFTFLVFNPLLLYLANMVSSDALFISLGLVWFVELIWLVERPGGWRVFSTLLLLVLLFFTRYTALCCPVVAAIAFLLTRKKPAFIVSGILAGCLLAWLGVMLVRHLTWKETGTKVFTAFSAWQIANNALHIYPYIKVDTADLPDAECRELDRTVSAYFDTAGASLREHPYPIAITEYMWSDHLPLKKYYWSIRDRLHTHHFNTWTSVAPLYTRYGYYLIKKHPFLFTRYYLLPSAHSFFFPPLETLSQYNEGLTVTDKGAADWFGWKDNKVTARWPNLQGVLLAPFPWLFLTLNIMALAALVLFLLFAGWRRFLWQQQAVFVRGWLMVMGYYAVYTAFSIYATSTVSRYQVMPFLLLLPFTVRYYAVYWRFIFPRTALTPGESKPME